MISSVSVLFAREDSVYKSLCSDVWDARRDARNYSGPNPVVCHPPCAQWGRLSRLAFNDPAQKACGPFAINQVGEAPCVIDTSVRDGSRRWCSKREREATPPAFAAWLIDLAQRCRKAAL